jgi:uncharacterized membrane protein (UPF0127 family)
MSKTSINIILFIAGCIILYMISNRLIAEHAIPTLDEYIASSTASVASSTTDIASTTKSSSNSTVATSSKEILNLPVTTIFSSKGSIKAFIADTDATRTQGLSDIPSLSDGVGMLFVFQSPGNYGFWMKDMKFPLDLIWVNEDKTIAGVTKNALPSSYPFIFPPPHDISYVLEMNAGSVEKFGLKTGTSVKFTLPVDNF